MWKFLEIVQMVMLLSSLGVLVMALFLATFEALMLR